MTPADQAERPPNIGQADWLTRAETVAVFDALEQAGHQVRVVGGAVRNELLGLPVTDIDFATTARPDETIAAANRAGLRSVATGLAHGTVTLVVFGASFEVTTLRKDIDTDGRHAVVAFTDDWAADAGRRDFTFNALYADRAGTVFDLVGGLPDLLAGRVRFIGTARDRIREDYLRILRFFRFNARYGKGAYDPEALTAAVAERRGLALLSAERVRQELLKLLAAPRAIEALKAMFDYGLLGEVLPACPALQRLSRLSHIEHELGRTADPVLRLAALVIEVSEDAERVADRLRLSNEERNTLRTAATLDTRLTPDLAPNDARAMLYQLGAGRWTFHVMLTWARRSASPADARWRALLALPESEPPAVFPIPGRDIVELGVQPGPTVGEIMKSLECWWIEQGFPPDGPDLRRELRRLVSENLRN